MLHGLWGMWLWHRKAEGDHSPSDSLSLPEFALISNNPYKLLNRFNAAGFCFVLKQKSRGLVKTFPRFIED
jgi:hypothetical protein